MLFAGAVTVNRKPVLFTVPAENGLFFPQTLNLDPHELFYFIRLGDLLAKVVSNVDR